MDTHIQATNLVIAVGTNNRSGVTSSTVEELKKAMNAARKHAQNAYFLGVSVAPSMDVKCKHTVEHRQNLEALNNFASSHLKKCFIQPLDPSMVSVSPTDNVYGIHQS
jgi:hypothetical protein